MRGRVPPDFPDVLGEPPPQVLGERGPQEAASWGTFLSVAPTVLPRSCGTVTRGLVSTRWGLASCARGLELELPLPNIHREGGSVQPRRTWGHPKSLGSGSPQCHLPPESHAGPARPPVPPHCPGRPTSVFPLSSGGSCSWMFRDPAPAPRGTAIAPQPTVGFRGGSSQH